METPTCCVVLDKNWLTEVPRITCIELHETAKLLPQLINTEELKEDDMTEEEERSSSPASSSSVTQLNPRPSLVSTVDDQGAEMIAESSTRKNSMSTHQPQKPPNVPLVPSVFSSEVIPKYTVKHPQHYGLVPDISIEDSSYYVAPSPSEVAHPPSPLVNNRLIVPSSERRSSIPKLPQIPASHKPHTQPIRPRHHSHNPTHHSSRMLSPDSGKKPTVPLQLQYVRQQHQMPIQDTSRAIHPSGMVGGVFTSRRRRLTHPGYIKKEEQPVNFTPPVVSYGAMTKVYPDTHFYFADPPPQVNDSLKPVCVPFDYLRKTSRKVVQPSKPSEENESVGELAHSLIEKETTLQEKEERKKKILRKATLLHLDESDDKAEYIVDFKNIKVDAKTKQIVNKLRGGVMSKLDNLTEEIRDDYDQFLSEVDAVTFYARRQAEELLQNYSPRILLVISSAAPKAELLQAATKPEVLTLIYDFELDSYASLLRKIKELLDRYMIGAKSKSLAFVCKGGPGYMYLLQKKPITPAKLLKENDLLKFWKEIGCLMSKVSLSDPSVVHLMECNVAGNRQGMELLSNLEAAMFTNRVKVFSPLELEPKGREMIDTYFFPDKFKTWKLKRYSKVKLF